MCLGGFLLATEATSQKILIYNSTELFEGMGSHGCSEIYFSECVLVLKLHILPENSHE